MFLLVVQLMMQIEFTR